MTDFAVKGTEYDLTLTSADVPCKVKVGGKTEKFVPNINASKWNDECWLNINHPDVVDKEAELYADGKVSLSVGERTHRFYVDDKGRLEYEIEIAKRPATDQLVFNLDFPEGLEFWYQPALTDAQIKAGYHRPENIIDSYAIYWCKRNNQYKNGKFGHIDRIRLIDANGKWTWAGQDITGHLWTILMDGKWLDKAAYPVIVDPVLGYDTPGASNLGNASYVLGGSYTTNADGGAITMFYCAIESINAGTPAFKMGVSETNGSGNPSGQALIEQVVGTAIENETVQTSPSTGETLSGNTEYFIGWIPAHGDTDVRYDATGGGWNNVSTAYADEFANPMTAGYGSGSECWSIWLDYGGGGPTEYQASSTDGFKFGDLGAAESVLYGAATDGFKVGDLTATRLELYNAVVDGFKIGDLPTATADKYTDVIDGLKIGDTPTSSLELFGQIVDGIKLGDLTETYLELFQQVLDGIKFGDLVQEGGALIYNVSVLDGIRLGDSLSATADKSAIAIDGIKFGDTGRLNVEWSVTCRDGIEFGEIVSAIMTWYTSATDGIKFGDLAAEGVTTYSGLARVTFSNKQISMTFTHKKPGTGFTAKKPGVEFS